MNQGKIKMIVMKVVILNKAIESKANIIAVDLHFRLAAQLGYQFLDPGSPRQFLVASGYRATTKWYSDWKFSLRGKILNRTTFIVPGSAAEPDADVDVDGRNFGVRDPGFTSGRPGTEPNDGSH